MDNIIVDMQEYVVLQENFPGPSNATQTPTMSTENYCQQLDYKWNVNNSKLLIDLYSKYREKVGTFQIRNIKMLWQKIAGELQKLNVHVTPNNCLNRWRVLERNYKKFIDNNNRTGRGRKYFEYVAEIEEIFGQKKNIHPDFLLASDTRDDVSEEVIIPENVIEEKKKDLETLQEKKPSKCKITRKRTTTIENIRLDRKAYYDARLDIERKNWKC